MDPVDMANYILDRNKMFERLADDTKTMHGYFVKAGFSEEQAVVLSSVFFQVTWSMMLSSEKT